jgi:hypothetical protein
MSMASATVADCEDGSGGWGGMGWMPRWWLVTVDGGACAVASFGQEREKWPLWLQL